ncbi:MAG: hypothetical protein IT379_20275 [Deltaproteobacteria bacterium]|nr:hypothetical protein [Deltaproteobacteria bacterium]
MADPKKGSSKGIIVLVVVAVLVVLVVPCIGVLAAVAIPSFIGYTRRSKVTEARSNLRLLAGLVERRCATERVATAQAGLPEAAGPVPTVVPAGVAVVATSELAASTVFRDLGFAPTEPLRYTYEIVREGDAALLRARGDLDGDGQTSLFELRCEGRACTCDSVVRVENELE